MTVMSTGTRSAHTYLTIGIAAMAALLLVACKKATPPDGVCTYEQLPAGAEVPSGQGGIQVLASTDAYFMVRDTTGKQIASAHVNGMTPVPAGDYQVVLNNSMHAASAQSKMLTKCTTGAVLVTARPMSIMRCSTKQPSNWPRRTWRRLSRCFLEAIRFA